MCMASRMKETRASTTSLDASPYVDGLVAHSNFPDKLDSAFTG